MNPIWISDDQRFRLEGPYAMQPSKPQTLELTAPSGPDPTLELRFIPYDQLPVFLAGRKKGSAPYADDRSVFPEVQPTHESSPSKTKEGATLHEYAFRSDARDGAYLAIVTPGPSQGGEAARFHVVIANRKTIRFPSAGVQDLAQIIVRHVNASYQLGVIYLVFGAVFFAEYYLNVVVSNALKAEIAESATTEVPFTARDRKEAEFLRTGRELGGISYVWLDEPEEIPIDDDDEERPCFNYYGLRETGPEEIRHA